MTKLQKELFKLQDTKYADFQANLTPSVDRKSFIGVRVPKLRAFAKEYFKDPDCEKFLHTLPHQYYEETLLHGFLLTYIKDYNQCLKETEALLPYMDNWAVSDTTSPKVFAKNKDKLLKVLPKWIKSKHTYTCRFGICMLMRHYLDEDFKPEYINLVVPIKSDEYYINMMIAWFLATSLAKQWDSTIHVLQDNILSDWVHNKTIQKAIESYRITDRQKDYLRSLKRTKTLS